MQIPTNEKELKEFQESMDKMIGAFNEMKLQVNEYEKLIAPSNQMAAALQISVDNLMTTIKNIHITLNAHNELFIGCEPINEMMKDIAKFILSSESIKSGVRSHEY